MNFLKNKDMILAVALGAVAALVMLMLMPILRDNILFILGIPFVLIFLLVAVMDIKYMLVFLLFTRALLDPILDYTKISVAGVETGIGGGLNLLIIVFAIFVFMSEPKKILKTKFLLVWGIFLLICFISIFYSPDLGGALKIFLNIVTYMCMAFLPFVLVKTEEDHKFWMKVLLYSSFLPILFAFADLSMGGAQYLDAGMRIKGTFTHPNILAFYLVFVMAVVLYFLRGGRFALRQVSTGLLWTYLAFLVILLLSTKTRSAWIACWVMFFVYGLLHEKKFIVYCLVGPFILLLYPGAWDRVSELFMRKNISVISPITSLAWREKLWGDAFSLIIKRPFFGYGLSSFSDLSPIFFKYSGQAKEVQAHNAYLEFLFETGLAGMLSYISILWYAFGSFLRRVKLKVQSAGAYSILTAYMLSYIIINASDNVIYYLAFNWYFWFFVGLMLRSLDFRDEEK